VKGVVNRKQTVARKEGIVANERSTTTQEEEEDIENETVDLPIRHKLSKSEK
jgi:hypothetical protein